MDESAIDYDPRYKKSRSSAPQSDQKSPENDKKPEENGDKGKRGLGSGSGSLQEPTPTQQQSEVKEESWEEESEETPTQANNLPSSEDKSIPVSIVISDESGIEAFAQNPQIPQILVTEPPQSPPVSGSDPSSSSESPEPEGGLGHDYPPCYSVVPMGNMSGQFSSRPNDNDAESMPRPFLTDSRSLAAQNTHESSFSTPGGTSKSPAMVPGNGNLRFEDIQEDFRFEKMLYEDDAKIDELPRRSDTFRENSRYNHENQEAIKSKNKVSTSGIEGIFDQNYFTDPPRDMGKGADKSNFDTVRDTRSFDERIAGRVEAMSEEEQIQAAIQASLGQPTNFDDPSPTLPEEEYTGVLPAASRNNDGDDDDDWLDEEEQIPIARVWSRSEEQSPKELELSNFHKEIWLSKLDQNAGRHPGDFFGPEPSRSWASKSKKSLGARSTSPSTYPRFAKDDTSGYSSAKNGHGDNIYGISPESYLGSQAGLPATTDEASYNQLMPQVSTRELDKVSLEKEALQEKEAELREQQNLLMEQMRILQEEVDLQEALQRSILYEDSRWHTEGSSKAQETSSSQSDRRIQRIELPRSPHKDPDRARELQDPYKKGPFELRYRRIRPRQILSQGPLKSSYHAPIRRELPLRELEHNLSSIDMSKDDTITMISNQKLASVKYTVHDPSLLRLNTSNDTIPIQTNQSVKLDSEDMIRTESKRLPAKQSHPSLLVQEPIMKDRDFSRPLTPMQTMSPRDNLSSQEPSFPNNDVNDESEAMSRGKTVIWNPVRATPQSNTKVSNSSAPSMEKMRDGQTTRWVASASYSEDNLGSSSHFEYTSFSPYSPRLFNVPLPIPQASAIPTMQELQEFVNNPKNSPPHVQETPQCKFHFQAPGDERAILATSKKQKSAEGHRMFKHIRQRRRHYWKQSIFQKERAFTQAFRPVPQADSNRGTTIIPHSDLCFSENINGVEKFVKEGRAWQKRRQYLDHNQHHQYKKFKTYIHPQSQATTSRDSSMFRSDWQGLCGEEFIVRERKDITDEILKMTKLYDKVLHGRDSPSQNSKDLEELDVLLNSMYARGSLLTMEKYDATSKEDHIRYRVEQISKAQTEFVTLTLWSSCAQWVSDIISEDLPMFQKMHHVHGSSEPSQWLRKMHERREIRRITVKFLNGLRPDDPYDKFIVPPLGPYPHLEKEPTIVGRSTPPHRGRVYTNTQRSRVAKMAPGEGMNNLRKYREIAQAQYGLELERPYSVAEGETLPPLGTDTPRPGTFADPINLNKVNDILISDTTQDSENPQDIQNIQGAQGPQNPQERIAHEQYKIQSATKNESDFEDGVAFDKPLYYPDNDPDDRRRLGIEIHDEKPLGSVDGTLENNLNQFSTGRRTNNRYLIGPEDLLDKPALERMHTGKDVQFAYLYPNNTPQIMQGQQKEDEGSRFGEPASQSKVSPEVDMLKSYKSTIAQLEARHGRNKLPYMRDVRPPEDEMDVNRSSSEVAHSGAMDIDSPDSTLDLNSSPPDNINGLRAENKTLRNLIQVILFQTSNKDLVSSVHRIRESENLEDDLESMVGLQKVDHSSEDLRDSLETQGDPVQQEKTVTSPKNISMSDRLLLPPPNDAPLMTDEASTSNIHNDDASDDMTRLQSLSNDLRRGGNTTVSDIRGRLMKQRRSPASISLKKVEAEQPPAKEDESEGKAKEALEKQKDDYYRKLKIPRLIPGTSLIADITSASGKPMSVQEWAGRGVKNCFGLDHAQEAGSETHRMEQKKISSEQEILQEQSLSQMPELPSNDVEIVVTPQRSEALLSRDDSSRQNISAETAHPSVDGAELGNVPGPSRKRNTNMSRAESDDEKNCPRKRRKSLNDDVGAGEMPSSSRKRNDPMTRVESDDEKESPRKRHRTRLSRVIRDR